MDEVFEKEYVRETSSYKNMSQEFRVPRKSLRDYGVQYSHLYFTRLGTLKTRLKDSAQKKWGDKYIMVDELKDVKVGDKCIVIGTLFKKMCLRPNILKEFSEKHKLAPQPSRAKYSSVNDELILEDTIQRITLYGNIVHSELVTGIVVAILGEETDNGRFRVDEMCFAGIPKLSVDPPLIEHDRYVVLVSGLSIGSAWSDDCSIQMFIDYICGQMGDGKDNEFCSKISRVIIAGNSLSDSPVQSESNKENKVRFTSRNYSAGTVEAMTQFDQYLSQLVSSVTCDLMPGSYDPCNYQLPHQPLHKCMFPISSKYAGLNTVTNPYRCMINDRSFLGTSGENVTDIVRCAEGIDPLTVLESTLEWNHLAPTAPDTLGCYPYKDQDPFILDDCPQVYFVGNQNSYQHKIITDKSDKHQVLLVCVPSFDMTHSVVTVNLRTLESDELCFSTSLKIKPNPNLENSSFTGGGGQDRDLLQELDSDGDDEM